MATEQAGVNDIPDAWEREAWVAVTVTGGAQVAAWRPRPWLPGYLFRSHFFIVDGCGYLFREGFWEIFKIFLGGFVKTPVVLRMGSGQLLLRKLLKKPADHGSRSESFGAGNKVSRRNEDRG